MWILSLFFLPLFTFSFFFVNECHCCTSSIVHFHCLAISYVCQICGPFCQRYLMIVHVRLYGLCQRSCVKFKIENVVFCMLYHLNVYILVLQFAQHWPFDQPKLWKRPLRFSKVVEKCAWGKKVGKKITEKKYTTHWFEAYESQDNRYSSPNSCSNACYDWAPNPCVLLNRLFFQHYELVAHYFQLLLIN